jgi:hypothetical protein
MLFVAIPILSSYKDNYGIQGSGEEQIAIHPLLPLQIFSGN